MVRPIAHHDRGRVRFPCIEFRVAVSLGRVAVLAQPVNGEGGMVAAVAGRGVGFENSAAGRERGGDEPDDVRAVEIKEGGEGEGAGADYADVHFEDADRGKDLCLAKVVFKSRNMRKHGSLSGGFENRACEKRTSISLV